MERSDNASRAALHHNLHSQRLREILSLTVKDLAPGFLIAMPQLGDPNFHRTVVLMIEHTDEGSMGLVINRASGLTLSQLGKNQKLKVASALAGNPVFVGGPVEPYRGFVLHDSKDVEEKVELCRGSSSR